MNELDETAGGEEMTPVGAASAVLQTGMSEDCIPEAHSIARSMTPSWSSSRGLRWLILHISITIRRIGCEIQCAQTWARWNRGVAPRTSQKNFAKGILVDINKCYLHCSCRL
jgi:hypothetical protein